MVVDAKEDWSVSAYNSSRIQGDDVDRMYDTRLQITGAYLCSN